MTPSEQKTPTPRTDAFFNRKPTGPWAERLEKEMSALETSLAAQTAEVERLKKLAEGWESRYNSLNADNQIAVENMQSLRASITAKDEALNYALRASDPDEDWDEIAAKIQAALSPSAGSELLERLKAAEKCRDMLGTALNLWFMQGSSELASAALAEWRKHFPEPKTQTKTQ